MTHPKIIEHQSISNAELRDLLKNVKKRDGELSFRGQKTEEYLDQIGTLKAKDAEALFESIKKMDLPRFKDEHINKIIDVLPRNVNELKMVMQGYALTVSNENMAKVQKAIDEYLDKRITPAPMKIEAPPAAVAEEVAGPMEPTTAPPAAQPPVE